MAKQLTPEQLAYIQQYLREHPGYTGPITGVPGINPRFGSNSGTTVNLGGGLFGGGDTPPISGGSYDPTLPTFPNGPTLPPGFNNPAPTPTPPTSTTDPNVPKKGGGIDWKKLLGQYGGKAGDLGDLLSNLLAGRAKGRVDEAKTNIDVQKLENEMYQDALQRAIVGRMMQINWDPMTPPANLVPYLPKELQGTKDFNAGRDDTFAKELVSGAEDTLAHPPTFDASKLTSQPNWIDKTLSITSPILSGLGIFGNNTPRPTTPTTPTNTPPPATTPRPTTPTSTSPSLPPYTSPTGTGAGLTTPPDPSDPWSIYMEQQRRRRLGQPGL